MDAVEHTFQTDPQAGPTTTDAVRSDMLSDRIRELRKRAGLSQDALAERIGVSRQAVTKWETNAGLPDISNLTALAHLFEVSVDELLENTPLARAGEKGYLFTSLTQCDVKDARSFDINVCGSRRIVAEPSPDGRVCVLLGSDTIGLMDKLRVYLDQGRNFDVDVTRLEGVTDAECREGLDVIVRLPQTDRGVELTGNTTELVLRGLDCPHVEFGGRVSTVVIDGLVGHVELDANGDVDVSCASLPDKLDLNQHGAASRIVVPKGSEFATRTRGIRNRIVLEGVEEDEDACHVIELNGFASELTIVGA